MKSVCIALAALVLLAMGLDVFAADIPSAMAHLAAAMAVR